MLAGNQSAIPPVAGYSLWLDAADPSVFTFSSGSRVSQWSDKSGNSNHFTNNNSASQPDRSATQGGKSAVKFDVGGATYYLTNTSLGDWSASSFTVFVVVDLNNGSFTGIIGRNSLAALQLGADGSNVNVAISRIGQATSSSTLAYTGTNADVVTFKSAGVSGGNITVTPYRNGTSASNISIAITSAGDKNALGAMRDGAADSFGDDGYICEVLLYPSQLSDSNRSSVETYLKAKWGTP